MASENNTTASTIRPIFAGAPNLNSINESVRIFEKKNAAGSGYKLNHGTYNKTQLNEINFSIMSMTIPPMTKVIIYTSNDIYPSASGQLLISNTKMSPLIISDLGMDVNSMNINKMSIIPIVNRAQIQNRISNGNGTQGTDMNNKVVKITAEPFSNNKHQIPKYTTPEMALCLIFIVLLVYIIYSYNSTV